MPRLDLTPLTPMALVLFLVSLVTVALGVLERRHLKLTTNYVGITMAVIMTVLALLAVDNTILRIGLLAGAILTIIIGHLDEQYTLSPWVQLLGQILIVGIIVATGWRVLHITNPLSEGVIVFTNPALLSIGGIGTMLWLLFMMNAVNWFDGVDGLAGSVSSVAFITLATISLLPATQDTTTLNLSLIGLGATLAFLRWNWPPAQVYLGTVGSWFLGLYLGMVAIVGGGKLATTALVLAVPLLDVVLVIGQRLWHGRAPWQGDQLYHLHHRLLARGFSAGQISLAAAAVSAVSGLAAVTLQTRYKLIVLALIFVVLIMVTVYLVVTGQHRTVRR
jgi:UDP-GlcNAc:undecaprenyl-phosphate GlcNAc-1-phosphate transferase